MDDITSKYPSFDSLDDQRKLIFLFNSIDTFICRKLGYFIYEAFEQRNEPKVSRIIKASIWVSMVLTVNRQMAKNRQKRNIFTVIRQMGKPILFEQQLIANRQMAGNLTVSRQNGL